MKSSSSANKRTSSSSSSSSSSSESTIDDCNIENRNKNINTTTKKKDNNGATTINDEHKPLPLSLLLVIFIIALASITFLVLKFPSLSDLPRSFEDVKQLSDILNQYTDDNYFIVITTYAFIYIFLQAFSIPGSIFLSFLSGALFGIWVGFPLVCAVATIGATCSYMSSYYIVRNLVKKFFPDKLTVFATEVNKRRSNLLNYIIFLRITPFLPNWFINLASPIIDVPIGTFMIGTFVGIAPATFIAVKAGLSLQELTKPSDIFDTKSILSMALLALLSILPTLDPVKRRLDKLLNKKQE
ncbi:hypothetical protein DFA_09695 [Cavenderia fasciculata]|uniref:VTT domain-containing protein n=1 Tax=Cavenderia fasciculata TaxID=261658 RepID=F4Q8C3_CACFS|nr:uncharacterized protein DFA_09695 [Cavenderia fasciculata]EGG16023.1 hypothetical protein DFA_09695 [Cavenderia fasciculata]|eukprot:XP_004352348.1 hypothetical protein DFA_09695 [Cavenderia fasciculata]